MGGRAGPDIVEDGLVLCLDAANPKSYSGSGTVWNDLSGGGNSGTLINGPTYSSANGGSIVFDGTDDHVSVNFSNTQTSATFVSWIKRNGNQNWAGILFSRGTNNTGMNFRSTSNQLGYHWNSPGSNAQNWDSGLVVPDNEWCMVCLAVSPTIAIAYLCTSSGISSATNTISHTPTTIDSLLIGRDTAVADRYFKGNIAASMLYSVTLSGEQVAQNLNATRGRFGL